MLQNKASEWVAKTSAFNDYGMPEVSEWLDSHNWKLIDQLLKLFGDTIISGLEK